MNRIQNYIALFVIFFSFQIVFAQNKDIPAGKELVRQLTEAYNQFDSDKSTQLLNLALKSLDKFSSEDQIEIYKIAGFIAFQNSNSSLAVNHFWSLLNIDPTYSPDPVTTPPKLVTLFQKTKIEYLEDMNRRMLQLQKSEKPVTSWRAILFPGWEQWHRGYKTKGIVLSTFGLVNLGGFVYSVIQTQRNKGRYQEANQPEVVQSLYSDYNSFYRQQYSFAYGFAAVWAFSQMDLLLWSKPEIRVQPSLSFFDPNLSGNSSFICQLSINF
jgi:hypothetical protein